MTIGFKNASHTVSEGMQARLVVALVERAERDIEFTVTTRDGTADCEWRNVFNHTYLYMYVCRYSSIMVSAFMSKSVPPFHCCSSR